MNCAKGQSSLEFLYTVGFVLVFFIAVLLIYMSAQSDILVMYEDSEARAVCMAAAGQISAIAAAGDGASSVLNLPKQTVERTISVNAETRSISVTDGKQVSGCRVTTSDISDGVSGNFEMEDGMPIKNIGGVIVVG